MKNKLSLIIMMLVGLVPCSAQAAKDNLITIYSSAKAKDPSIGRAQAQRDMSKAETDIAFSQLLPRVDANASVNWISSTTLNYGPSEMSGSYTGDGYGVAVRIPVFQLPAFYGLAGSQASERAADANVTGTRQDLMIQVVDLYFSLLKAKAEETFWREDEKRYGQLLEQAQALQQSGAGDILAVYDARARLENALTAMVKAESQRKQATLQLSNIAGIQVSEVMDLGLYQPREPVPSDIKWWLDIQQKQHPALVRARESLSQSEHQIKSARAGHLPTLQASAGYTVSKGSTFLPQVETRQWYAGFNLSLPIYAGGESAAKTRRAMAVESEQGFVLSAAHDQIIQKLKQFYLDIELNTALIASLNRKKDVAEQLLEAIKVGHSLGTRTAAELLNSEQNVASIQRELTKTCHEHALRSLSLKYAAGILEEADLIAINSELSK